MSAQPIPKDCPSPRPQDDPLTVIDQFIACARYNGRHGSWDSECEMRSSSAAAAVGVLRAREGGQ